MLIRAIGLFMLCLIGQFNLSAQAKQDVTALSGIAASASGAAVGEESLSSAASGNAEEETVPVLRDFINDTFFAGMIIDTREAMIAAFGEPISILSQNDASLMKYDEIRKCQAYEYRWGLFIFYATTRQDDPTRYIKSS